MYKARDQLMCLTAGQHCKIATYLDRKDVKDVEDWQNNHREDNQKPENDCQDSFDKVLEICDRCQFYLYLSASTGQ